MTNEELQAKYQGILDLANSNGWQYNLSGGDDGVLHMDVNVPDENAKQQVWDKYNEIDPGYAGGDLVLNTNVGGSEAAGAGANTYTVVSGDNLSKIGEKYGLSWQQIFEANKDIISDPDMIHPGQELKIPSA
jgi:nucleoid-associated protein YgaU